MRAALTGSITFCSWAAIHRLPSGRIAAARGPRRRRPSWMLLAGTRAPEDAAYGLHQRLRGAGLDEISGRSVVLPVGDRLVRIERAQQHDGKRPAVVAA